MVLLLGAPSQVFSPWFLLVTVFALSAKQWLDKRWTLEEPLWECTGLQSCLGAPVPCALSLAAPAFCYRSGCSYGPFPGAFH